MQIDQLPQVSDILGSFIGDAGDVILKNQQGGRFVVCAGYFLYVNHRAIGDATHLVKPCPPLPLDLFRPLGFAAQKKVGRQKSAGSAQN